MSKSGDIRPPMPPQPYPGLRAFTADEWPIFFGREDAVRDVAARLLSNGVVAVHGGAGCGKSSLVTAGVLPHLAAELAGSGGRWFTAEVRPSRDPFGMLSRALAGVDGRVLATRVKELRAILDSGTDAPAALAAALGCGGDSRVCILLDQFEEHVDQAGARAPPLMDVIAALAAAQPEGLHLVLTSRSSRLGLYARHPGFAQALNGADYLVPCMDRDALLLAIRKPAALFGAAVDAGLAGRLVEDTDGNRDQLALIQHAMMLMWRVKPPDRAKLEPEEEFQPPGAAAEQFSAHMDRVMDAAVRAPGDERHVENLFRALVGPDGTDASILRRRRVSDLLALTDAPRDTLVRIIDCFRSNDAAFLRPHGDRPLADDDEIRITSEVVVRNWKRIAAPGTGWRDREVEDGLVWASLRSAAADFEAGRGAHAAPAAAAGHAAWIAGRNAVWAKVHGGGWDAVNRMVAESARRARGLALRRRLSTIAIAAVALLGLAAVAVTAWLMLDARTRARNGEARLLTVQHERDAARDLVDAAQVAQSRHLALLSRRETAEGRPDVALGLALAGLPDDVAASDPTRPVAAPAVTALTEALHADRRLAVLGGGAGEVTAAAFSPDGRHMAAAGAFGRAWLWDAATAALIAELAGHGDRIEAIAFSPDGRRLATASADRTVRVWDAATGAQALLLDGHAQGVRAVAFSPDGTRIATASEDGTARLWNAVSGEQAALLRGHRDWLWSLAFSPDGTRLVTGSLDGTARLWSLPQGSQLAVLEGHAGELVSAVFSPDGARVATASLDGTVRLWNGADGAPLAVLEGSGREVHAVAFSPDGARIASASADGLVRVWNVATGELLLTLAGHDSTVLSVAFSPDGTSLATASADRTARLWDARRGGERAVLARHRAAVASAVFSPDGGRVLTASADGTAQLADTSADDAVAVMAGPGGAMRNAAFMPDGTRILTASDDGAARLWNAADGMELARLEGHAGGLRQAVASPDGARVATVSDDGTARLWNASGAGEPTVLEGHAGPVTGAAFSPDGTRLVTASADRTARIWDAAGGSLLVVLEGHEGAVHAVAISPDGRRVATASADATARLWDVARSSETAVLRGHADDVLSVAFSPDGSLIATASEDGTARLWQGDGTAMALLDGHDGPVLAVRFSPRGDRLVTASADATARLWSADDGAGIAVLRGHRHWVTDAAFSPSGDRLATASADGTVRLWDADEGAGIAVLDGHSGPVRSVAFSADGARLVTASDDGSARIWSGDADLRTQLPRARAAQFRPLSARERRERDLPAAAAVPTRPPSLRAGACDRLASHPFDPGALAPGVLLTDVDAPAALAACEAAVAAQPADAHRRYLLGRTLDAVGRNGEARQAYQAAADGGYVFAMFVLANLHRRGEGGPVDHARALTLYGVALERGVAVAGGPLGAMHWSGEGTPQNRARAMEIWRTAAARGDPYAHRNLAWVAEIGREGEKADPALALRHYAAAVAMLESAGIEDDDVAGMRYRRAALARLLDAPVVSRAWREAMALAGSGVQSDPSVAR